MDISVHELIRSRRDAKSERGRRADPHHLALVIEGGGMRGVVAGGMVTALEERLLLDCFDTIHGSSAGACAGAYFLAGQARLGTRIYYEDINNTKFIDRWRPLRGLPIMDTRFLIYRVMRIDKPLDVGQIVACKDMLHIVATESSTGEARVYKEFRNAEHFYAILRGSISIPVIAGSSVDVDGVQLVDGGVVEQIAFRSAVEAGASHILVMMTREEGGLERPDPKMKTWLQAMILKMMYGLNLAEAYKRRNKQINQTLAEIDDPPPGLAVDRIVRRSGAVVVDRLTTDAVSLKRAGKDGREAVLSYLDAIHGSRR